MIDFFKRNRDKLYDILENGDAVILFAGNATRKRGDENYFFSPDRNFYYMTGLERENFVFFMYKDSDKRYERIYIEPSNGQQAKWIGETLSAHKVQEISGIEDIKFLGEFNNDFEAKKNIIYRLYLDWDRTDLKTDQTREGYKKKYDYLEIKDVFHIIAEFRTIKENEEIELIEKAIDITNLAIKDMMKNSKSGMMEYEIEAYYDYILKKNGVRDRAFQTITAAGKNATVLHYVENNSLAKDGDLVLVDAGAQVGWYNGDISRTFPVNGKFTDRQKLVYNIVLGGQKLVMETIKPGYPMPLLNEVLKSYYYDELKKIGLVTIKEDVFKYYYHNVGHFLGAQTHDVGDRSQSLKEGMVITVEPGLYIEEWEIGIRIEDDVLITKDGCRNLSEGMIKTVEEIEAFMAGNE